MAPRTYPGTVLEIHDGDVVRVQADLGFDTWRVLDVRLNGCNAIELSDPGDPEARDRLAGLLGVQAAALRVGPDAAGGGMPAWLNPLAIASATARRTVSCWPG
jgi:hypothetical protein